MFNNKTEIKEVLSKEVSLLDQHNRACAVINVRLLGVVRNSVGLK
jgi:hypothetical protein